MNRIIRLSDGSTMTPQEFRSCFLAKANDAANFASASFSDGRYLSFWVSVISVEMSFLSISCPMREISLLLSALFIFMALWLRREAGALFRYWMEHRQYLLTKIREVELTLAELEKNDERL